MLSGEGSKQSFFEKKDQKTFASPPASEPGFSLQKRAPAETNGAVVQAQGQKFFASFLQKRRPSLLAVRDRLVTQSSFRSWAAKFPLTRFVARRRTSELFDLCAGFVYSQILSASVELHLFDVLAAGPLSATEVAQRLDLPEEGAQRLLDGCVALRLVSRRGGGRYGLGALGAAMVDNPGLAAMIVHHRLLYADLADPVAILRGSGDTGLSQYWAYRRNASGPDVSGYSALMAATQPMVADEILDAYPVGRHRCLMDVGGGDGAFLAAAAGRAPNLRLVLFDLPAVAARAALRFESLGLAARAQVVAGSFLTDALPRGADIISLVRVIHDHDDAEVRVLLRAVRAALPDGGVLLLGEPMAETPGAARMGDAYFGFYLLAMGSGRPRSSASLTVLLQECGFGRVRRVATSTPLLASVLVAECKS